MDFSAFRAIEISELITQKMTNINIIHVQYNVDCPNYQLLQKPVPSFHVQIRSIKPIYSTMKLVNPCSIEHKIQKKFKTPHTSFEK